MKPTSWLARSYGETDIAATSRASGESPSPQIQRPSEVGKPMDDSEGGDGEVSDIDDDDNDIDVEDDEDDEDDDMGRA